MTTSTATRIATEAARQNIAANDPRFADFVAYQYRCLTNGFRDGTPELVAKVSAELAK